VSGIADPFNGHIDAFHIAHVQRSDGWIATTWNKMSNPGVLSRHRRGAGRRRATAAGRHWRGRLRHGVRGMFGAAWDHVMVAHRGVNPLAVLWPEMDAALVTVTHPLRCGGRW